MDSPVEDRLRQRVFDWVADRAARRGGWLTREELLRGYRPDGGEPLPLIDFSRGIRNPASLAATLSIVHAVDGPYADRDSGDGLLHYAYRRGGTGGDNRKLRAAHELGSPLLLLVKPEPNVYVPVAPVYVVADDEAAREFVVALDEAFRYLPDPAHLPADQRRYALRLARTRLHQPVFRGWVVRAYGTRCAICRLAHGELLEAAHIYPDSDECGRPVVPNGLSLCSIHHTAYDRALLGITPDLEVRLDADLLAEIDGPMLRHGLRGCTAGLCPSRSERWTTPTGRRWPGATSSSPAGSGASRRAGDRGVDERQPRAGVGSAGLDAGARDLVSRLTTTRATSATGSETITALTSSERPRLSQVTVVTVASSIEVRTPAVVALGQNSTANTAGAMATPYTVYA